MLNASEGITIQITKQQETDETLDIYLYIIQDAQINFEEGDSKTLSIEFPKYAHSAILCGQTSCGKTMFVLDLLEFEYKDFFNIVILCPHYKMEQTIEKQEMDW